MNKYDSYYYYYYYYYYCCCCYYDLVSGHQTAVTAFLKKNSTFITPCKRTSVVGANISSSKRTDLRKLELTLQFHPIYTTPRSIFLLVNPDRIKKNSRIEKDRRQNGLPKFWASIS